MRYEDGQWVERVLKKLYGLHLNDRLPVSGYYWVCDWDKNLDEAMNLQNCEAEIKALTALSNMGVIELEVIENYFRADKIRRQELTDAALHFSEIPVITSFNAKRFTDYCKLIEFNPSISAMLPPVELELGAFRVHKANVISYQNKLVDLRPQARNVAALIMKNSRNGSYTSYDAIIENCLTTSRSEQLYEEIRRMVSDTRAAFRSAAHREHNYFPSKQGVGYIFSP